MACTRLSQQYSQGPQTITSQHDALYASTTNRAQFGQRSFSGAFAESNVLQESVDIFADFTGAIAYLAKSSSDASSVGAAMVVETPKRRDVERRISQIVQGSAVCAITGDTVMRQGFFLTVRPVGAFESRGLGLAKGLLRWYRLGTMSSK